MKDSEFNFEKLQSKAANLDNLQQLFSKEYDTLKNFFNNINCFACITNYKAHTFVYVNKKFADFLEYNQQEMIGQSYFNFMTLDTKIKAIKLFEEIQNKDFKNPSNFITEYKSKSGKIKKIAWNGTPPDADGLSYSVAFGLDHIYDGH